MSDKYTIWRIWLNKIGSSTHYPLNKSGNKPLNVEHSTVILLRLLANGSYVAYRILPCQILPPHNQLLCCHGKNFQKCCKNECYKEIAMRFCGLETRDPSIYSFYKKREDLDQWRTNPYVKAITDNSQCRH